MQCYALPMYPTRAVHLDSQVTHRFSWGDCRPKYISRIVPAWLCGYAEKQLDKKAKVNFKICDVTDWTTNNYTNKYTFCPTCRGNQKTRFGHLIEYSMRNALIEKSYTTCCGEASPRPFNKKLKLSSLYQQLEIQTKMLNLYKAF